jgi:hypothetical protein
MITQVNYEKLDSVLKAIAEAQRLLAKPSLSSIDGVDEARMAIDAAQTAVNRLITGERSALAHTASQWCMPR